MTNSALPPSADVLTLLKEDEAQIDALFSQKAAHGSTSLEASRYLTQVEASKLSEGTQPARENRTSEVGFDPLTNPALAGTGNRHPNSGTHGQNASSANTPNTPGANALAGIGSRVGGASTGSSSAGGGSLGGSGGGASGGTNQLATLGIQGAFANPALSATAPTGPMTAATPSAATAMHSSTARTFSPQDSPPPDSPPVAGNDSFSVVHDRLLLGNVMTNDTNSDGDQLTASLVGSGPSNGTLSFNSDGSFT